MLLTGLDCSQLGIHRVDLLVDSIAHVVVADDVDDAAVVVVAELAVLEPDDHCRRDVMNCFEIGHSLVSHI